MTRSAWRFGALALVVGLVLADTAIWWASQRTVAQGVARWQAAMQASGIEVRIAGSAPGGWPLAASRTLTGIRLRGGMASLAIEQATLRLSALAPDALVISLPGDVSPARAAAPLSGRPGLPVLHARAARWTIRIPLRGGPVDVDARDLRVDILGAAADAPPRTLGVALAHLRIDAAQGPVAETSLVGSAQSIALPLAPGETWPLGPRVASIAFAARLHGRLSSPFLEAPALTAWRDAGGAVAIDRFALGYGPLGVSGDGRFTLDPALQPEGRATLHLVGQTETVDALQAAHVIPSHVAIAVEAVLALLAHAPPGGGTPQVDTDLVLGDGVVSVAGFPLLRLPRLAWPES